MNKKLPIGLSDFKRLIEDDYYYIDKSLLIKELMDDGSSVILLPRPRRFGKTLNISMLKYFFQKSNTDTSYLFKNLAIWTQDEKYREMQGKYPVLFITFKDIKDRCWDSTYNKIKLLISSLYEEHRYLLDTEVLSEKEKNIFKKIASLEAENFHYDLSIRDLSLYLERYHKRKVIILMDEYDVPIQSGYFNGYYDDIVNFMRNFLSGALKDNSSLEKGVLTGILRVAKESLFSGINNLNVSSFLNYKFSNHFGLLEDEVVTILNYYNIGFQMKEIKDWYNGYIFGENVIYNPWSVINYADKWKDGLRPYWVNTSSNDLVRKLLTTSPPEVKNELELLIKGETLNKVISDDIVFGDIEKSTNTLWSFLLFSGYLKAESKELIEGTLYCNLVIPNKEVKYLYNNIILSWFEESIYSDKLSNMLKGLTSGDLETFEYIFREFVMKTFSYFDVSGTEPEKVYHAFVLGLLVSLGSTHFVKSNRESGYGRYDVLIIPKDLTKKGIVIEFKKVNKFRNETLEAAVDLALKQIDDKNYAEELITFGVKDIIKLAIVFDGKDVMIKKGC